MAKLSEVLGGIVKDVTQAQITSDLVSMEYLEHYQRDDLLKHMPVPRMRIKDVSLTLRFAVSETVIPAQVTDSGAAEAAAAWAQHVQKAFVPELLRSLTKEAAVSGELKEAVDAAVRAQRPPAVDDRALLSTRTARNTKRTADYVAEIVKSLPRDLRAEMLPLKEIRRATSRAARTELAALAPTLKRVAVAKTAEEVGLEVMISADELEAVPESDIHEITLTLGLDETRVEL